MALVFIGWLPQSVMTKH